MERPAVFDYQLLDHSLIVGALLIAVGLVGFITRRNLPSLLLGAGVAAGGVILSLAAVGNFYGNRSGEAFALTALLACFATALIAAAVGMAITGSRGSLDISRWHALGSDPIVTDPPAVDVDATTPSEANPADHNQSGTARLSSTLRLRPDGSSPKSARGENSH